jgi:hypothetical protein
MTEQAYKLSKQKQLAARAKIRAIVDAQKPKTFNQTGASK